VEGNYYVSQISYTYEQIPISEVMKDLSAEDHIVVVQDPVSQKQYLKICFPKQTHYMMNEETIYEEFVSEYVVIDVLRSDTLKAGDHFWVWHEPAYGLEDVKQYHEIGLSISPDIMVREPEFPVKGDQRIVFVSSCISKGNAEFPAVYSIWADEGLEAIVKLQTLLNVSKKMARK
jgi:hypothetical protein